MCYEPIIADKSFENSYIYAKVDKSIKTAKTCTTAKPVFTKETKLKLSQKSAQVSYKQL